MVREALRNPENLLKSLCSHNSQKDYRYKNLYRNLYNPELYLAAYRNISKNDGALTKGVNENTADGMSLARIDALIASLRDESYRPAPVRRTYIPKKSNPAKLRPLGIPTFEDKLLQDVIRMLLEAIYEGQFEKTSHGFRPKRSCHTALIDMQRSFTGTKWFIEGDIKGFFDNINHDVMISILRGKIDDERFLRLIRKILNAGYMENWIYHKTYSGTPQGGLCSPILANIYLDRFDKFVEEYRKGFDRGSKRHPTTESRRFETRIRILRKHLKAASDDADRKALVKQIRELEQERMKIPYSDPMDPNYRRLRYIRYADDWICGVIGSLEDCKKIKEDFRRYLADNLKLTLSEEKTLITNAKDKAHFLGYEIYARNTDSSKRDSEGKLIRHLKGRIALEVSNSVIKEHLLRDKAMKIVMHNGTEVWRPMPIVRMKDCDDLEILDFYNSKIRGLYNYYSIANNASCLTSYGYIMEYSMYKTFGAKYRTSKHFIIEKYRVGHDFGVSYTDRKGKTITRLLYNGGFRHRTEILPASVDQKPVTGKYFSDTRLTDRLKARRCEVCGAENRDIEIHHVHRLKDLNGKNFWERLMISRNRKTIALCHECHRKLHGGEL